MPLGRRCDLGCESWPDKQIYATCPLCGEKTTRFNNLVSVLDEDEAEVLLLNRQFEKFYAKWCAQRGLPTDGPLPLTEEEAEGLEELCAESPSV